MKLFKKDWLDIPVIALLLANAIPLFGVLFLDWDAFSIVLLYWSNPVRHKDCIVLYGGRIAQYYFSQITYFKLARSSSSCLNAFYEQQKA